MKVIPAIDIMGGKVVRLLQGDAKKVTVYSDSPVEVAKNWDLYGVDMIHVVDLDGAFGGELKNLGVIAEIARSVNAKVEIGGGMRDEAAIEKALGAGIYKVVIGTKALDSAFLKSAGKRFGEHIAVAIDVRSGLVYTRGWVEKTGVKAPDLIREIARCGIKTVIYTDISRDGTLEGPNIESLRGVLGKAKIEIIASGGVSGIEDIKKLKSLEKDGLAGVIIGKALYENKIDLKEVVSVCSQKG